MKAAEASLGPVEKRRGKKEKEGRFVRLEDSHISR